MIVYFVALYCLIGAVFGYTVARGVYNQPRKIPGNMPPRNLPIALMAWLVYGAVWPLLAITLGCALAGIAANKWSGQKVGDLLFGRKENR